MKNLKIEIKWAIIFVLMMLVWMSLERLFGLHDTYIEKHPVFTNFVAIPAIAIYVLALLDKRDNFYQGKMTYLQGLVCGLIITMIVTIFSPLTQVITSLVITPHYFQNAIDYAVTEGKMTQAAAEEYFNLKNYIIQGLIGAPIMGLLTSIVVAIFTRKK
ncbi:DUF4199 domain-containing protein [Aquiflexum sp.]|uniref:DUF4199 domain-containing protein n=1 Tax=Aquiflexum sp. TaxID=1872584 RepID=UPI003594284E